MKLTGLLGRSVSAALLAAGLAITLSAPAYAQAAKPAPAKEAPAQPSFQARQQPVDATITEDPAINEMLSKYSASLKEQLNVIIGNAPEVINKEGTAAGRLGMLISDIIRHSASKKLGRNVDVSIQNNGGLRAEIPAGKVTVGTIYRLMPFDNEVAVVEMSGGDLIEMFEGMGSNIKDYGTAVSGAELVYRDGKLVSAKVAGKPVDRQATYTLGLTDYLYKGGEALVMKGKNYQGTGLLLRDAIIDYIRAEHNAGRALVPPSGARVTVEK